MKLHFLKFSLLILGSIVLLSSCKKDRDEENEEEVITTMQLTFVPVSGGATLTFQFDDPDGPGGNNPTIDQIALAANTTYNVSLQLLNKTVSPVENITTEVAAEAASHRFYYQPSAGSNITVSNFNTDAAGIPLGLTSAWTTGNAANGTIKITLRHYPGNPPNKATDDPVNSTKSSTDIEVNFSTRVQ
ncbi:MAG: hypothetical protein ACR2KB_03360 [Chitinophagaceae bacterium]